MTPLELIRWAVAFAFASVAAGFGALVIGGAAWMIRNKWRD